MGVDLAEIIVKADIAKGEVLKPSIGKAKACCAAQAEEHGDGESRVIGIGCGCESGCPPPPTPTRDAVARGRSVLAKRLPTGAPWRVIAAAHGKADEQEGVAEAVVAAAERMVLTSNESEIECVKAATQIRDIQRAYLAMKDNLTYQGLIESFVSLSSNVSKARKAATDSTSTQAKADSVARWRSSAKRIAEMAKAGTLPADAVPRSEDRNAANWDRFLRRFWSRPKAAVEDVADREVRADYALPLSIFNRVMRLRRENVVRSLVEESPSFRSGLLTLRLATLPALNARVGDFNDAVAKACRETYVQVTNAYFLGMFKLLTNWVGGKEAFGDNHEAMDKVLGIAKHGRNACCGVDFAEARSLAAFGSSFVGSIWML